MARVCVIYGSETGNTRRKTNKLVKEWEGRSGRNFKVDAPVSGDEASGRFDTLSQDYDVLILITSSFGDGDPPDGYHKFLAALYEGAKKEEGEKPLEGVQHHVLGFGSTMYETFQNCPRLTDQLLEANGSRRFLKRKEMDEMMEETEDENLSNWDKEVFGMLNETTRDSAKQPSVCAWDDGFDGKCEVQSRDFAESASGGGGNSNMTMLLAILVAVLAAAYYYMKNQEA
eukprot:CAMPEP_0185765574 /NCGR_PEP_ID=MMETSP1174-20130828/30863_1 /TAXON_ID=35687 /ORGANISM="Dictyocha speculum, Strain CCMP1381" /LENGTH=228 /DNA_ID=CAMNT_0028448805 /DNA_START=53 /DNA_END=739 /DNA_ORIENTATION=+